MIKNGDPVRVVALNAYTGSRGTVVEVSGDTIKVNIPGLGDRKFSRGEVATEGQPFTVWVRDIQEVQVTVQRPTEDEAAIAGFQAIFDLEEFEGDDIDVDVIVANGEGFTTEHHVSVRWKLVPDIQHDRI